MYHDQKPCLAEFSLFRNKKDTWHSCMPGYWSILCSSLHHLLWMKQLWQAEGRRTVQKSVFSCPALAFHCCGSSSGRPSACLHPSQFPLMSLPGSLGAPGSSWLQELHPYPVQGSPFLRGESCSPVLGSLLAAHGAGGALIEGGVPWAQDHVRNTGWAAQCQHDLGACKMS